MQITRLCLELATYNFSTSVQMHNILNHFVIQICIINFICGLFKGAVSDSDYIL
jgi:uncharacterized membrane protein